jgi:hypothetical protein
MCLFLCANLNAQQLLQPTIDRSWRRSLDLCVWHADDPNERFILMSNRSIVPARTSERAARPIRGNTIAIPPVASQRWPTVCDDLAENRDQAKKSFAHAWACLRRWLRGRL